MVLVHQTYILLFSLTMAVISSKPCKNSTIFDLWDGSTLAKQQAFRTAFFWSYGERSSNSRPVKALLVTSSSSEKMPMRRQMATAVPLLSPGREHRRKKKILSFLFNLRGVMSGLVDPPVIIMTRMPAALHSSMELMTSLRGGSSMPTQPTKVKSVWKKEIKMLNANLGGIRFKTWF